MDVEVYSSGLVSCSVCAPPNMAPEDVAQRVNELHPAGTDNGWSISDDKHFADGKTENGGLVSCHRGETRHWLLHC